MASDVSMQMLYSNTKSGLFAGMNTPMPLGITNILKHLPGIQIREYLPDTRLDQCINMAMSIFNGVKNMFDKKDESGTSGSQQEKKEDANGIMNKLMRVSWYAIKYLTAGVDPNFYDDLSLSENLPFSSYSKNVVDGTSGVPPGRYVLTFPFALYYAMQSCVTTNIYEIPAIDSSKRISSSDGQKGWQGSGVRLSEIFGKGNMGPIGSIVNMLLGNIGIHYMPWWDAASGSDTTEPEIELKFDLFNDSAQSAMDNFLFVNTLVPNNKWIQYNMFQHSSCLYDVKIEGLNRLYACSGSFSVTYDGVLRDPPMKFIYDLVLAHANPNCMNINMFLQNILSYNLIKIPDVYHVTMKFNSLLPANFNNYLFTYAENANHMVKYADKTYEPSTMSKAFGTAVGRFMKRAGAIWDVQEQRAFDKAGRTADEATAAALGKDFAVEQAIEDDA